MPNDSAIRRDILLNKMHMIEDSLFQGLRVALSQHWFSGCLYRKSAQRGWAQTLLSRLITCSSPSTPLSRLHYLHKQLFDLLPPSLIPKCRCKIDHNWSAYPNIPLDQHPQTRLHYLNTQVLGLLPPFLVPVCRCKIGHAVKLRRTIIRQ